MKIENAHRDQIRTKFQDLETKQDLVGLLSLAKNLMYAKECQPFQLKQLTYYANPKICKKRYKAFTIPKKNGSGRTIHAPVKGLKSLLRALNFVLHCVQEAHPAAKGFVINESIVSNAKLHVGKTYVYNLDLADFFHSFDSNRVKLALIKTPFHLKGEKEPLAFLIANLVTHPFEIEGIIKTVLPQGSPTSPTITNIMCVKLDRRLLGLAKRFGANYSRYADDITFSSYHDIYKNEEFLKELNRIISEDNLYKFKEETKTIGPTLKINPNKTRLQSSAYRQEVTGLTVNEKVNVKRRYIKQIRMYLYYWETYGYKKAEEKYKCDYTKDKGYSKREPSNFLRVLSGKLEFLKMVKGEDDPTFAKLNKRYMELAGSKVASLSGVLNLETVVTSIIDGHLEKGLEQYDRIKKSRNEG